MILPSPWFDLDAKEIRNVEFLCSAKQSEEVLLEIASSLGTDSEYVRKCVAILYTYLSEQQCDCEHFDWNVGSIIQHLRAECVIQALKDFDYKTLYNSIGIAWVLGELNIKDGFVVGYLHDVIKHSTNADAWWRAAFSLEKLGQEAALVFLKKSLKNEGLDTLAHYLDSLSSKRSVVGILLLANSNSIRETIYPSLKKNFIEHTDKKTVINCVWLLGRFRLLDKEINQRIAEIFARADDYETVYYTCLAVYESAIYQFEGIFQALLHSEDGLLRKMAARALSYIDHPNNHLLLENALASEQNYGVVSEITQGLYRIADPQTKVRIQIKREYSVIENGLIVDETDKWYSDAALYDIFSAAEDPLNVCLGLIFNKLVADGHSVANPVDLATGTGRALRYFVDKLQYDGTFYGVDLNTGMLEFGKKTIYREQKHINNVEFVHSSIVDLALPVKSSLIISSFGFPSKITNIELCKQELTAVYNHLDENGLFITLGWDETFNDDLNAYWYRHIPDGIDARSFEEWRSKRAALIPTARNSNLDWFKRGLRVPLQFASIKEAASIMGRMFGRDAVDDILTNSTTTWMMSLGITLNTKKSIGVVLGNQKGVLT